MGGQGTTNFSGALTLAIATMIAAQHACSAKYRVLRADNSALSYNARNGTASAHDSGVESTLSNVGKNFNSTLKESFSFKRVLLQLTLEKRRSGSSMASALGRS